MKWAWGIGLVLAIAVDGLSADEPIKDYGSVEIIESQNLEYRVQATVQILIWNGPLTLSDIDSALGHVEEYYLGIYLRVPDCHDADSTLIKEAAGRFTPWKLSEISPTGKWQWDGPMVVLLPDSSSCPIFLQLGERRWTSIVVGTDPESNRKAVKELRDLIRRYKRERADRLEGLFRK